jgi:hypothetical protein
MMEPNSASARSASVVVRASAAATEYDRLTARPAASACRRACVSHSVRRCAMFCGLGGTARNDAGTCPATAPAAPAAPAGTDEDGDSGVELTDSRRPVEATSGAATTGAGAGTAGAGLGASSATSSKGDTSPLACASCGDADSAGTCTVRGGDTGPPPSTGDVGATGVAFGTGASNSHSITHNKHQTTLASASRPLTVGPSRTYPEPCDVTSKPQASQRSARPPLACAARVRLCTLRRRN